jgi:hypothetical protein
MIPLFVVPLTSLLLSLFGVVISGWSKGGVAASVSIAFVVSGAAAVAVGRILLLAGAGMDLL